MNKIETNVIKPDLGFLENDVDYVILEPQFEVILDDKIQDIIEYMKNEGKGKSEAEKDELYNNAQTMWKELIAILTDVKYNFYLNREQYKFLTDLILTKLEYDVNTVFYAIELTDMLGNMKTESNYKSDKDLLPFPVTATEITYIYHLISKHKVKGLTRSSYIFAQVLRRIADISKVFNYYDTTGKNLSTDIQNWAYSFEDGVFVEKKEIDPIETDLEKE